MRILVFGNPYLRFDSLALEVAKEIKLKDVEFVTCSSPEQIMQEEFDCILDVVEGITDVITFSDLKMLNPHRMFSLHDFDVTFFLGLMERLGKLDKVHIIGIPMNYNKEQAIKEVENKITEIEGHLRTKV